MPSAYGAAPAVFDAERHGRRSQGDRSPLYTSAGGPLFRPGCRNPASKDGKLWDTTDAFESTDGKLRVGKSPESSACTFGWLPSMDWISASMPI